MNHIPYQEQNNSLTNIYKLQLRRQPPSPTQPNSLPIHIRTLQYPPHSPSKLSRLPETPRIHNTIIFQAPARLVGEVGRHAALEDPGGNGDGADGVPGEIAGKGKGHGAESTFCGGVCSLAGLAFELGGNILLISVKVRRDRWNSDRGCTGHEDDDTSFTVRTVLGRYVYEVLQCKPGKVERPREVDRQCKIP